MDGIKRKFLHRTFIPFPSFLGEIEDWRCLWEIITHYQWCFVNQNTWEEFEESSSVAAVLEKRGEESCCFLTKKKKKKKERIDERKSWQRQNREDALRPVGNAEKMWWPLKMVFTSHLRPITRIQRLFQLKTANVFKVSASQGGHCD